MKSGGRSVRLFSLGRTIEGRPNFVEPATFKSIDAEEVKDIERWIKREPMLLGEEIRIVASQLSNWDKTKDRPDLVGLDQQGKLVVIEIKRDASAKGQDLQAMRYASYASTMTSDEVAALYQTYRAEEHGERLTHGEAAQQLDNFLEGNDLASLDDDDKPRIILVGPAFPAGVTSTVLWLRNFAIDISCVQIQPYVLRGEIVLASSTLIPLPEATDYEVKIQSKRLKSASKSSVPIDKAAAEAFIASIPKGRWTSYGDVAIAAGSPKGAKAIGSWLQSEETDVPLVYRVLNKTGVVNKGWTALDPKLPQTTADVEAKLTDEGIVFKDGKAIKEQRWTAEDWTRVLQGRRFP